MATAEETKKGNGTGERESKGASDGGAAKGQAEQPQNGGGAGSSRGGAVLKAGALAAAAGTAAFAANKALSARKQGGDGDTEKPSASSREKPSGERQGSRLPTEQLVSALTHARWDVVKDMVVPFAESGATQAGAYVAREGPELLTDRLLPKFIESFNKAKGDQGARSEA